jgi:transposase-like protein
MSERRTYTKEEREQALADVVTMGVVGAARKLGAPQSCVSRWAKDAGVRRATPPARSSAPKPKTKTSGSKAEPEPKEQPTAAAPNRGEPAAAASESAPVVAPIRRTLTPRVAKLYTPSQKALVLEDAAKDGITAAAKKHEVSRFAIYAWQRKVAKAAEGQGPSPTSGPSPCESAEQRDKEILDEWRRHPGLGPSQIRNQLRRKNIKVSCDHRYSTRCCACWGGGAG